MGSGSPPTWDGGARNMPAADYFFGLCNAVLGLRCAIAISEYYGDRRKESAELKAKWVFWDLAAVNAMSRISIARRRLRNKPRRQAR